MVELGAEAVDQLRKLRDHYEDKGRPEAALNLVRAVARAIDRIGLAPMTGLAAPRPYPALARTGQRWIKEGRYWFAYSTTAPPVILAIFFETADIPGRRLLP